jgi:hypothetical protein
MRGVIEGTRGINFGELINEAEDYWIERKEFFEDIG